MKILNIIFLLFFLYPVSELSADRSLGWMDDIYYFPYPEYESYYFKGNKETTFGDFYILDENTGYIYHPRTASYWYVYGESGDSLFLYGPNWEVWAWTSKYVFPWIYFYDCKDRDIINPTWGYLKHIEIRPDGKIWAQMIFPLTSSGGLSRVPLPF